MIIQVGFVFYITVLYVALVIYRFEYIATHTHHQEASLILLFGG